MPAQNGTCVNISPKIDFAILGAYADGRRDVPTNVAQKIDENRSYVNTRYGYLRDYGLLERVGPSDTSGLYQITPKGLAALRLRDEHGRADYDQLVDERARQIEIRPPEIVDQGE